LPSSALFAWGQLELRRHHPRIAPKHVQNGMGHVLGMDFPGGITDATWEGVFPG
jgi:hypothetical protein